MEDFRILAVSVQKTGVEAKENSSLAIRIKPTSYSSALGKF
jgi:hypothetical protein